jgi:hypothetical protein
VLHSAFADQALERGLADSAALERISAGWLAWAQAPDGTFLMPEHGNPRAVLTCRPGAGPVGHRRLHELL